MNIYFLVEGKTEAIVYPDWLAHLLPDFSRVKDAFDVRENNYFLFNGGGFPSLLHNHLRNTVEDINKINKFDYLVICLDADDFSVEEREGEVLQFIENQSITLNNFTNLVIIVQNKCIKTWFLGNAKIFKQNPENEDLRNYIAFFDVSKQDPEQMYKPENYTATIAHFHEVYLKAMFQEHGLSYSKTNQREIQKKYYLDELILRNENTKHISTFGAFIDFCKRVN